MLSRKVLQRLQLNRSAFVDIMPPVRVGGDDLGADNMIGNRLRKLCYFANPTTTLGVSGLSDRHRPFRTPLSTTRSQNSAIAPLQHIPLMLKGRVKADKALRRDRHPPIPNSLKHLT